MSLVKHNVRDNISPRADVKLGYAVDRVEDGTWRECFLARAYGSQTRNPLIASISRLT
jgi:hypothetical protein